MDKIINFTFNCFEITGFIVFIVCFLAFLIASVLKMMHKSTGKKRAKIINLTLELGFNIMMIFAIIIAIEATIISIHNDFKFTAVVLGIVIALTLIFLLFKTYNWIAKDDNGEKITTKKEK